nr:hypothetical protein [Tanacetum cinerariifolium]
MIKILVKGYGSVDIVDVVLILVILQPKGTKTHGVDRVNSNCPKCENPVDGQYCQGCALLRNELKEVWFTICEENEMFQGLLDTSESSNDNTNVVNAPQEPFVVKQDPGKNSSQSPSHINHHCCYGCGDSLEDIFCHHCTCESCGKAATLLRPPPPPYATITPRTVATITTSIETTPPPHPLYRHHLYLTDSTTADQPTPSSPSSTPRPRTMVSISQPPPPLKQRPKRVHWFSSTTTI